MFDFFRKHLRLIQIVMFPLILLAFGMVGIQGYSRFTGEGRAVVAKVAGHDISQAEWDAAHRNQVERLRRQMPGIDPNMLDAPEMRRQTLDSLVRERVLLAAADKLHLQTTDDRLIRLFASDPQFAVVRKPDGSLNKELLAAQGMSPELFEQQLRQDLSLRQVLQGVAGTVFATPAVASPALDALFQQREVQVQRFEAKDHATKVSPTDADIEAFYKDPANAAQFQAPEQANIEYVVLDVDALKKGITVPEEDLRKYYSENASRFTTPEERRASHILVKVDAGASADVRAKAKAKAEMLLAEVKKDPAKFADLARKNSDDPGSAEKGGDLDFFGRGAMVKPFEEVAFSLSPGQTSGLVETDFGYHIIQLAAARGGEKQSFESVRAELENEIRTQQAQKKFAELAVEFSNVVYEQPDSLKPAADRFKLELRTAKAVARTPAPQASGPLASAKFLDAVFGTDAIRNKRNTEAVETGPNQMVSGRVLEYSPARLQPLADVRDKIRTRLVVQQAAAAARKEGEARLAALKAAPQTALPGEPMAVSRMVAKDVPRELVDAVLRADTAKLPTLIGVDLGDQGYAIARISKVLGRDPAAADAVQGQAQYAQSWADAETQAYYAALKKRFKAELQDSALAKSESKGSGEAR